MKREGFYSNHFCNISYFEDDDKQNYLVFQTVSFSNRYFFKKS